MKNPWKKLDSKNIYENPWIKVREDQVINPNGGQNIYGVVGFKNLAIGIIPVDEFGNTWIVGQYRYTLDEYSWEIPMGGGPIGINALESAKRELKEETGLLADHWKCIMRIHTSNSVTDEVGYVFLATGLELDDPDPEETEKLEVKKLSLGEAYKMVMRNKITDSLSIGGILKTWDLFNSGGLSSLPDEVLSPWS